MALRIDSVKTVSITSASAVEEEVNYRAFMISNPSDKTLYLKECAEDDVDVTADNGFAIPAATFCDKVFRAKTLSLKGSGSGTIKIMYVIEE